MISDTLSKARQYEEEQMPLIPDADRPVFHLTGNTGWINDPNGFSYYGGRYHLFYQYYPYAPVWGPMHWGHAVSDDLIRWERLPAALAPDTEPDRDGCFSGSALALPDGRHLLIYTGVRKGTDRNGEERLRQVQCAAFGDGKEYEKYAGNPVIGEQDIPENGSIWDFRDPKIWRDEDGRFRMAVANRAEDGSGAVRMYESGDALHWTYTGTLDASRNRLGSMWECPDFFRLGSSHVISISAMEMQAEGLEFQPGNNALFIVGDYDPVRKAFIRKSIHAADCGTDFYAAQTMQAPDGRRIMAAWMQNWASSARKPDTMRFFGEITVPRELSLLDGRVMQNPVRELERYRKNAVLYDHIRIGKETVLPGISGRVLDMTVTVRPAESSLFRLFRIRIAKGGEYETCISFDPVQAVIRTDRTRSGYPYDVVNVREFRTDPWDGAIKIRLIMDRHSLELFVLDGRQAASFMIRTPQEADGISFEAEGAAALVDIEKYEICI